MAFAASNLRATLGVPGRGSAELRLQRLTAQTCFAIGDYLPSHILEDHGSCCTADTAVRIQEASHGDEPASDAEGTVCGR